MPFRHGPPPGGGARGVPGGPGEPGWALPLRTTLAPAANRSIGQDARMPGGQGPWPPHLLASVAWLSLVIPRLSLALASGCSLGVWLTPCVYVCR